MGRRHIIMTVTAVVCMLAAATAVAQAQKEGIPGPPKRGTLSDWSDRLNWGADMRVRFTHMSSEVTNPTSAGNDVVDTEYIRWRTRFWIGYKVNEQVKIDARLTNMWRDYSSAPWDPNDQPTARWRFPDEVIFDKLAITMTDLFDCDGLSLTLGRQEIILGKGMTVLEGTWLDAGRTIYQDGALLTWKRDADTVKLFATYNTREDEFVVVNDRNRQLRHEDTLLYGIDWTRTWRDEFQTELYAMRHDTRDDVQAGPFSEVELMVLGGRVFGKPHELFDYSAEYAWQEGERSGADTDAEADMADIRLGFNAPAEWYGKPRLELEWTYMAGDDPNTTDEIEGWHPLFAEYPIWREEYFPNQFGAVWTNWDQYRVAASCSPIENLKVTAAWHYITRPEESATGDKVGNLYCLFLDYVVFNDPQAVVKKWVSSIEICHLQQGDWYADDDASGEWVRFQNVWTF